jgi:TRAP transporter TAXI family solute receptor
VVLIGAAAAALGGGGLAAALMTRADEAASAELILATGPKGAVYLVVGTDLSRALQAYSPSTRAIVLPTAATVENLGLLATRAADIGFASLDAAATDSGVRRGTLTVLCRVYDSCLHLVVLADSPVKSVRDLNGTRVSLGGSGSGTEFTVRNLLSVVGVRPSRLELLGQTPSMAALEAGTIDAAFSLTGFPTPAITELAERRDLRLVPLGEYFGDLERTVPRAYAPAPIPDGTYRGVSAVDSILVPNVLIARPGLPDAVVTLVMDTMFAEESKRFWTSPDSRRIDLGMATVTGAAPVHPAAREWLTRHRH